MINLRSDEQEIIQKPTIEFIKMKMGAAIDYELVDDETNYVQETYQAETNNSTSNQKKTSSIDDIKFQKKLMRDKDAGILGGVFAGLGHFFNINRIILRVVFILMVWIGIRYTISIYLILWAAIPKAKNDEDQLLMKKGRPVKLSQDRTINKSKGTVSFDGFMEQVIGFLKQMQPIFLNVVNVIGKGIATVYGFSILLILVIFCAAIGIGFFMAEDYLQQLAILLGINFGSIQPKLFIILSVPVLLLFVSLIYLVFNKNYFRAYYVLPLIATWIICIILMYNNGRMVFLDFKEMSKKEDIYKLENFGSDTLFVGVLETEVSPVFENGSKFIFDYDKMLLLREQFHTNFVFFDIQKSNDSIFKIIVEKQSHGKTIHAATERASNINYKWKQDFDHLLLSSYMSIDKYKNWRIQQVVLTLQIPKDKYVHLGRNMKSILSENSETAIAKSHMADKYWQMTDNGLSQ